MPVNSSSKPYDVFVSYSSSDRLYASRLAAELEDCGYVVWLDSWEVLVGHNIVDEVYKGISGSRFVAVLLSDTACQSEWVKNEFTAGLMSEIEARQVVVLPVKVGDCVIPTPLRNKRYADFTHSWEDGFRELTAAMDMHRLDMRLNPPAVGPQLPNRKPAGFGELDQWREGLLPEIAAAGFVEGQPFKDVLIGLTNGDTIDIEKTRLKPIVDASRVHLRRWGGPPFPYDKYPSTEEVRLQDGLRYFDIRPWPHRSQSFHFWQIDSRLRFLQRTHIDEDFCQNPAGNLYISGTLVRSWTLIDVMYPLLFAKNVLIHETGLESLGVKFVWSGLKERSLLELNPSRGRLPNTYYICQVPEWTCELEITRDTDIAAEALKAALDLFWLFGWEPEPGALDAIRSDLAALASGTLPD